MTDQSIIDDLQKALNTVKEIRSPDVILCHPNLAREIEKKKDVIPGNVILIPHPCVDKTKAYVITDEQLKKDILNAYRMRRARKDDTDE